MVFVWVFSIFYLITQTETVPPDVCFANFRWDDCGKPAVPVIYYWKPGSRCEVAYWRGCLPNPNMFRDEYECVDTCIFTARAQAVDFHVIEEKLLNQTFDDIFGSDETTTAPDSNSTATDSSANSTNTETNPTAGTGETGATDTNDEKTTKEGDSDATHTTPHEGENDVTAPEGGRVQKLSKHENGTDTTGGTDGTAEPHDDTAEPHDGTAEPHDGTAEPHNGTTAPHEVTTVHEGT